MADFNVTILRRDQVKVVLDTDHFDEKWLADFRQHFYDFETLREVAEHIAFNVVHNGNWEIDGIGVPMCDGEVPLQIRLLPNFKPEYVNPYVNVIYKPYDTEVEYE